MKTKAMTKEQKASELYDKVLNWVNREFNYIHVDVLNKCCDNQLFEYIRQPEITIEDIAEYEGQSGNKRWINAQMKEYPEIENNPLYDGVKENKDQNNYPMWNTCFEFRNEPSEELIQAGVKAGFGIIEGMDDFNALLFVAGCGYDFYRAHWIPMYLAYFESEQEKYKGIEYDNL